MIYYDAGAMLKIIEELEHQKDNGFKIGLKHLKDAASSTISVIKLFELLAGRVKRKKEALLTFASNIV